MTKQQIEDISNLLQNATLEEIETIAQTAMDAIATRTDAAQVIDLLAYYEIAIGQDAQGFKPCRKPRPRPCSQ